MLKTHNISLQIKDEVKQYTLMPDFQMVGALLAKKTRAKNSTLVYEISGQDPLEGDMPWSLGCPFSFQKVSYETMGMAPPFSQCALGYAMNLAFQGGNQIDMTQ